MAISIMYLLHEKKYGNIYNRAYGQARREGLTKQQSDVQASNAVRKVAGIKVYKPQPKKQQQNGEYNKEKHKSNSNDFLGMENELRQKGWF